MEMTLTEVNLRQPGAGAPGHSRSREAGDTRLSPEELSTTPRPPAMEALVEQLIRESADSVANIRVAFHVDMQTGEVTIKVIDNVTGEVVRSVPPQELAAMMRRLEDFTGLMVDRKR